MCGINGFIAEKGASQDSLVKKINSMNDSIFHRGPDDDGVYTFPRRNTPIAMGMRRLAVIDLESGKQPMFSENNEVAIVSTVKFIIIAK